jgi:hypothetical protein
MSIQRTAWILTSATLALPIALGTGCSGSSSSGSRR